MLIAESDGEVVGTVSVGGVGNQIPYMLRLFALDVGLRFRGRGIGTALIEAVERRARRQGLRGVNLEVGVDNGDAIRLYERLGYRRRGSPVAGESSWIVTKSL